MYEPFSSHDKALIRTSSVHLLEELHGVMHRQLSYLGLPSPWMGDIAAWRPHLGRVLAVEMEERFIPDLVDRAFTLGLFHQLSYYIGDIDTILQNGRDKDGRDLSGEFPVDLVNLDYCSGLVYDGFERIAALEGLFRRQGESLATVTGGRIPYFLLFITHHSHHAAGKQRVINDYIAYVTRNVAQYADDMRDRMIVLSEWYRSATCPIAYRHKVFVVGKVLEFAQAAGFRVFIERIVAYKGDRETPMLHYQFKVRPHTVGHPIPADSGISALDILEWPVVNAEDEDIASERP